MESTIRTTPPVDENRTAERLIADLKTLIQQAERKIVERAKIADQMVRENPYPTIAIAFGLGLLAGFLVRRK